MPTRPGDLPPQSVPFAQRLQWWLIRRGYGEMAPDPETGGDKFRITRGKQGPLAEKLGISQPSLSELISGESKGPSAAVLLKLCEVLDLRPEYLLTGEGAPEARSFETLSGPEAQLVMIYRNLPTDALRHTLMIEADAKLSRASAQQQAKHHDPKLVLSRRAESAPKMPKDVAPGTHLKPSRRGKLKHEPKMPGKPGS